MLSEDCSVVSTCDEGEIKEDDNKCEDGEECVDGRNGKECAPLG